MAGFQRLLEGECYVTSSIVPLAVYRIRQSYMTVISAEETMAPVKTLTEILLQDFNERFIPADDSGKVRYTTEPEIGEGKRYTGVHPFCFYAALLDPRTKGWLRTIMTDDDYAKLKEDVVDLMVGIVKANSETREVS